MSIIIVNWNVWDDLRECLESIFVSSFPEEMEVIVVDNASSDCSVANVQSQFPNVRIIANSTNAGFPKANNQALAVARGEFVLFLNPDTVIAPGTLSGCVSALRSQADIGLLGCKIKYPDGSIQYEGARNFPSLRTIFWEVFYLHMLFPKSPLFGEKLMGNWNHEGSRDVPCLLGAFMMGRRSLLVEMGGMDESVFMFLEDVDLCFRTVKNGWRVHYLADYQIIHKSMQSQKKKKRPMTYENATARYEFFRKHRGPAAALACRLLLFLKGAARFLISLFLFPVSLPFPRLQARLRNAHKPMVQLDLLKWAFTYRAAADE
ncbi:MAG: glycosyltransferase family 2 protein [Chloroflexota bacterium]